MRTIRASEIGSYLFCARAWWYQRNGTPSINEEFLQEGTTHHEQHGKQVASATASLRTGTVLLLVVAILIVVGLTMVLLP